MGQRDGRVDALAAWDNLAAPSAPSGCASAPPSRADARITKPALGVSNDYGIVQTPYLSDPDPEGHNEAFARYAAAGVDAMQVNIRGGSHEESAFIPGRVAPVPLGSATLRGQDLIAWYTTAWFDKYVKCPGARERARCARHADRRLLSDRWRDDPPGRAVDLSDDGNLFSFYLRSRFAFEGAAGRPIVCDDMRAGCTSMGPDGGPVPYSLLADAYRPDSGADPGPALRCSLPQRGRKGPDTPKTLPPTPAGDAIRGRGGRDRLRGGGGDDCLYGQRGRDRLSGGPGDDRLNGGRGRDRIRCGPGRDVVRGARGDRVAKDCERVER